MSVDLPTLTPGYSSNMDANNALSSAMFSSEASILGLSGVDAQNYLNTENGALGGGYSLNWNGQPLSDSQSVQNSLGLGVGNNPAIASLGQPLTGTNAPGTNTANLATGAAASNAPPSSLKSLFTGSLINVVFIVIGVILMAIGAAMMVSKGA